MSTTITTPTNRLAALIAVERESADRYRRATARINTTLAVYRVESDEYRVASGAEDSAMRAMVSAQCETDQALAGVSA